MTSVVRNGTTSIQIKTIHGEFSFEIQRYKLNHESITYFDWTEQFSQGYNSQRLQEYISYYSNRMSYEEVEKLVARTLGLVSSQQEGQRFHVNDCAKQARDIRVFTVYILASMERGDSDGYHLPPK